MSVILSLGGGVGLQAQGETEYRRMAEELVTLARRIAERERAVWHIATAMAESEAAQAAQEAALASRRKGDAFALFALLVGEGHSSRSGEFQSKNLRGRRAKAVRQWLMAGYAARAKELGAALAALERTERTLAAHIAQWGTAQQALARLREAQSSRLARMVKMEQAAETVRAEMRAQFARARGRLLAPASGGFVSRKSASAPSSPAMKGAEWRLTPGATIHAPWAALVRHVGAFGRFGRIVIVEPAPDYLILMAGFSEVRVKTGQRVAQGEALGLAGEGGNGAEAVRLYLELRHKGEARDPREWFGAG